jgi:EF-P beta-lysylation protein EpmB
VPKWKNGEWKRLLAEAFRSPAELLEALDLDAGHGSDTAAPWVDDFPVLVPRGFVARMERGNPDDPLLRQILPVAAEGVPADGYSKDPLVEAGVSPAAGVLHKYRGRALLVPTGACPVHCRYCFRRHFPYAEHGLVGERLEAAIAYLADDRSISEVILSGGDPLSLSDEFLARLSSRIGELPHVRRLRIHTRWPIVLPQRIDDDCLRWMDRVGPELVVVVHGNHPNEIDDDVEGALRGLGGVSLVLNQAVLLAGVNDSVETQVALSERLFEAGVLPYYLHLLDPVEGAAHFSVAPEAVESLYSELASRLPGYLLPRLVRELPGADSKTTFGTLVL